MGKRTRYEPGTFSWVDLATTDLEASKAFYGGLFGWKPHDSEVPGGGVYSMMRLGAADVAAIYDQPAEQRDAGVPPFWFSYVTVASADESAAAAGEAGGSVHAGPYDVLDAGRMAVIADPAGAMLGIWEPRENIGADLVNDPGCLTFNELATTDVAGSIRFYEKLFGWSVDGLDTGGGPPYWAIVHEGAANGRNGGMRELGPDEEGRPPSWMPYFSVSSADETIARTAKL